MGSPLGIDVVTKQLRDSGESKDRRYPGNIRHWYNFAAKHDFIAADSDIDDDFEDMEDFGLETIEDEDILNFAIRNGEANPHASIGYLIHPSVVRRIKKWMDK